MDINFLSATILVNGLVLIILGGVLGGFSNPVFCK